MFEPSLAAPICRIIARPNGAGKTTFALNHPPGVAPGTAFVNADLIAAGLSPLAPGESLFAATRLFLAQIQHHIATRRDFAFETTLLGRGYLRLIDRMRATGWRVELTYLALPSIELSRQRVAERVAQGGHAVAEADIARRFPRSLRNLLSVYAGAVDRARCFMNSGPGPEIVFVQQGADRAVLDPVAYDNLVKEANR